MSSIAERLQTWTVMNDQSPQIPAPPPYQVLWEHAKREALPLGQLFVVVTPLTPGIGAGYSADTKDVWVFHDADDLAYGLRSLLYILARIQRQPAPPVTIDADWNEEAAVVRYAAELAARWNVADLMSMEWLDERLASIENLREQHHQIALLAGSSDPRIARAAWAPIRTAVQQAGGTKEDAFLDALYGIHDDETLNAACVDWDRCMLRSWSLPFGPGKGFEALTLPHSDRTRAWLDEALRYAARHPGSLQLRQIDEEHQVGSVDLGVDRLGDAIALCQAVLLADVDTYLQVYWHMYGMADDVARVYRLSAMRRIDREQWQWQDVWILAAPRYERDQLAEAALQRFIRSWQRNTELRAEPLVGGLRSLMQPLAQRRVVN